MIVYNLTDPRNQIVIHEYTLPNQQITGEML